MEKFQTFSPRFAAMLIDSFIMIPLFVFNQWFREAEFPAWFFYFWIPLSSLVFLIYSITMNAKFGQTLGKMAMKVKILDITENPISLRQAILRDAWQIIVNGVSAIISIAALSFGEESSQIQNAFTVFGFFILLWTLAEILVFVTNDKRRTLHDLIAGTIVVKTES